MSLFVLLAVSILVQSQAPDDASGQTCAKAPVPDGVFRLLDSFWYETLLPNNTADAAGWSEMPAKSVSIRGRAAIPFQLRNIELYN